MSDNHVPGRRDVCAGYDLLTCAENACWTLLIIANSYLSLIIQKLMKGPRCLLLELTLPTVMQPITEIMNPGVSLLSRRIHTFYCKLKLGPLDVWKNMDSHEIYVPA